MDYQNPHPQQKTDNNVANKKKKNAKNLDTNNPPQDGPLQKILTAEEEKEKRLKQARQTMVDPQEYKNGSSRFPSNPFTAGDDQMEPRDSEDTDNSLN